MKIKLFLILLFSHYVLQSQNIEPLYHIRGHFENCNHGFLKNCYPFVTLRKGNEIIKDSLFFATDTSDYFFIDNLSKGKYTIEYYNFFNQKFDNQIDLIKNIDTLKFCDDLFEKDKEKGVIENLAEKDTFLIDYQMIACFDEDYKKVIFIKEKNKTIAKLYYSRPSKNSIKYYLKKKKKLSEKEYYCTDLKNKEKSEQKSG